MAGPGGVQAYRRTGKAVGSWTAYWYSSRQLEGVQDQQSAVGWRTRYAYMSKKVEEGSWQLTRAVSTLGENLHPGIIDWERAACHSGFDAG